ncbi:hypothetical protein PVAND_001536 [Polypedilum vanderplanki]|uniref:Ionotropic receptor n=1 Tax=Polypedilum vanderplanki TaxID=319348 RepID=A0A9J6BNQ7_POLVA|nr:hypothetical protein PVAND_001536 [Polypedilum vanderplanki]
MSIRKQIKFQFLFLIFLTFFHKTISSKSQVFESSLIDKSQTISKAISDIIFEFYISKTIKFDFIIYDENSDQINDIIDKITKELGENISQSTLMHIKNITNWNHQLKRSAIIFIKSLKSLQNFYKFAIKSRLIKTNQEKLKFMIYAEEVKTFQQLNEVIIETKNKIDFTKPADSRFYEFFITNDENFVNLTARLLFSEFHCGSFRSKLLNSFNLNSQKWNKKLENFDHYKNFYGCLVRFFVQYRYWYDIENHTKYYELKQKNDKIFEMKVRGENLKFPGIMFELSSLMAKKGNFTTYHTPSGISGSKSYFYYIRNYKYNWNDALEFHIRILTLEKQWHYSPPINRVKYYYLLSFNDYYSNYEKLLLPFDDLTWFLLLFIFGLSFIIINVLKFAPERIRILIYGRDVTRPGYNALGIFFGISQLKLPNESNCRLIWLLFIWFCLIFRTCWQSKMFEFMTTDMRKPLPDSFEDFLSMNYTVVYEVILNRKHKNNDKGISTLKVNYSTLSSLYEEALFEKSSQKYAFYISEDKHRILNKTFKNSLPKMDTFKINMLSEGIAIPKHCIFQQQFDDVIAQLIPSGILKHLENLRKWYYNRPIEEEPEDSLKVLSMSDLEFGFIIFLIAALLSIVVFIYEFLFLNLKKNFIKLIDLYEFLNALKEVLNKYHDKW